MIKAQRALQRAAGAWLRMMAPLRRHPYAVLMIGFVCGTMVTAGIRGDATQVVLGILAGLCLALVTMTAVWEHEDHKKARARMRRPK